MPYSHYTLDCFEKDSFQFVGEGKLVATSIWWPSNLLATPRANREQLIWKDIKKMKRKEESKGRAREEQDESRRLHCLIRAREKWLLGGQYN